MVFGSQNNEVINNLPLQVKGYPFIAGYRSSTITIKNLDSSRLLRRSTHCDTPVASCFGGKSTINVIAWYTCGISCEMVLLLHLAIPFGLNNKVAYGSCFPTYKESHLHQRSAYNDNPSVGTYCLHVVILPV
jgi:hypothetical protein